VLEFVGVAGGGAEVSTGSGLLVRLAACEGLPGVKVGVLVLCVVDGFSDSGDGFCDSKV
jgi:hypothetical protein